MSAPNGSRRCSGTCPPSSSAAPRLLKWTSAYLGALLGRRNRLSRDPSLATWIALNQWVSEGIPFACEAFRQMIHDLVQRNKLVKGEFRLRGRPVDLNDITCSLLSIAGTQDVICRVPQAEAIMGLAGDWPAPRSTRSGFTRTVNRRDRPWRAEADIGTIPSVATRDRDSRHRAVRDAAKTRIR